MTGAVAGHGWVTPLPNGGKARCGGPGLCPQCSQEAADAGFRGETALPEAPDLQVTCPNCGHQFDLPIRGTLHRATEG